MSKKIVVGLSGGVDSSVALLLLKKQGWQPIGVTLKLPVWKDKENLLRENICCTAQSINIAKKICEKLNVPYRIFDVRAEFKKEVVDYFISELKRGRTPNPCIICNRRLKFKKLFQFAKKVRADYVATGHYARVREIKNEKLNLAYRQAGMKNYELLRARDKNKDQTYTLSFLPQKWLKYIIFPLGDYTKSQVYRIALNEGLDFFIKRKQSQDFCFVAGRSLASFLEKKIGRKEGLIVDSKGKVLGKHQGLHFYTIGQRKGISLPNGPYFVKDFEASKKLLIVTKEKKEVSQKQVALSPYHFIANQTSDKKIKVKAKIRYRQPLSEAVLFPPKKGKLTIIFNQAQPAVTPGQFCVFYQNEVCLGGGVITPNLPLDKLFTNVLK